MVWLSPTLPEVLRSNRFDLALVGVDEARAAARGERQPTWHPDCPRPDDLDAFSMVKSLSLWGPRHIVRRVDSMVIGSVGFFGPPVAGADEVAEAEIGYGLVEYARGHGVATEVVRALVAACEVAEVRVRARTEPTNTASMRVLAKCGFTDLRGSDDEGNLVLARPLRG